MNFNVALLVGIKVDYNKMIKTVTTSTEVTCPCDVESEDPFCSKCGKNLTPTTRTYTVWDFNSFPTPLADILKTSGVEPVEAFYEDSWHLYPEYAKLMCFGELDQKFIGYWMDSLSKYDGDEAFSAYSMETLLDITSKVRQDLGELGFDGDPQLYVVSYWA